ncbi:MAG TPA: zinc-dependent metalloprotease [Bryobacteraceae bacterium]|nr:zinc-dependent metalloprotease [Bryobacteraceae bacterium]
MHRSTLAALVSLSMTALLPAQDPAPTPEPPAQTPAAATAGGGRGGLNPASQEPQPYEKVITKDAKTKAGIFTVHQIRERYYYEIPKAELNKDFLWNTQIAKTTFGVGYGGQQLADRVVWWELKGNKVNLRDSKFDVVADPKTPISMAVKAANNDTILMTFPVAAFSKTGDPVVDVTRLFTTDIPEIGARQRLGATTMDASRSSIERISPYPENIETVTEVTYTRTQPAPGAAAAQPSIFGGAMRPGSATIVLHHSMVKLPEKPMMPRVFDERVGFIYVRQTDYSREEHRAPQVRFVTRWRLEKKDPASALSEPVKPIVYYVDAATPTKWVPWIKRGIESWQKAFEAAGFKNAIIAKQAPTPSEDPNFSPEDVRNSVIRWLPSTIENASGPHISDPRTGEILNADIQFYHNIMNLQRDWYFLQVGPLDPRAQKLPLPDDLMGRLLEFVVAHEVGHTLGFQHNMKASSMYPQEKIRDPEWLKKMGHTPSIMDYSRFNYVAQPEDKIPVEDLIPGIGPYDIWATKWGYQPIPAAKTPDQEKPTLDLWAREQDKTPWFRFSTPGAAGGADPGELTEAVGDADALKSTALGIKNLHRVAKMLMPATTSTAGEPYSDLAELYGRMLGQWTVELNHVAAIVGGFNTQEKYVGQEGTLFLPVPKARQADAVKFLNENAFATPTWAIDPQILRRIEVIGVLSRIRNAQTSVLSSLLNSSRFARLVEQEAIDGASTYPPSEFLGDVRKGVWKELDAPNVKIDAYRRNLQRSYLDLVNIKVNSTANTPAGLPAELAVMFTASGDEKPMYRAELRSLNASINTALAKASDRQTRAHLEGARDQIAKILDPKFAPAGAGTGNAIRLGFDGLDLFSGAPAGLETCWPDYIIQP